MPTNVSNRRSLSVVTAVIFVMTGSVMSGAVSLNAIVPISVAPIGVARADWPQFRGPQGDGHAPTDRLPTTWNALRNIAWETEVSGRGWSSPVVTGNSIWLTTAEQTALPENERAEKLAKHKYGELEFQTHGLVTAYAVELDVRDGRILRRVELLKAESPAPIHSVNSYASPTPIFDQGRLYCHFGSLGTVAFDTKSGQVIWRAQFAVEEITGPGGSPALWRDRLIIACDGVDAQYVVAVDARTGAVMWKTPRPKIDAEGKHRRAFSTPLVIEHAGRQQVISTGAQWVVSYDPETGREWWRVNYGDGHAVVPRPVFHDGVVYICTGYMKPQLWAIRVDGTGDVSETHVVWRYDRQVPEVSSPIIVGSEIYFVSVLGVATCLDARTGTQLWQKRLGGNHGASPIASGDRIYFTSQEGDTTIVRAGREFQEIGQNHLNGLILSSPAVHDKALVIRSSERVYCIRE